LTETVAAIVAAHRAGTMTPAQTVARSYQRIRNYNDPAVFISLRDEKEALAEAEALAAKDAAALPLYGVPVAIKDNIDAQGLPTTAACPAFSYSPAQDSTAVAKLRAAGAVVIGKTNLDQFATGLVGVRSPYGIPVNPVRADLIPGGSSSGSAVAVSAGLVPLALGTDTAGSGRVPAMLNNIVGLKPSLGLVSTAGVVPACRTLDCVSVFSLTVDDAMTALRVMAGPDSGDPYSRNRPLAAAAAARDRLVVRCGGRRGGWAGSADHRLDHALCARCRAGDPRLGPGRALSGQLEPLPAPAWAVRRPLYSAGHPRGRGCAQHVLSRARRLRTDGGRG
jgi:allophanate hydrolase